MQVMVVREKVVMGQPDNARKLPQVTGTAAGGSISVSSVLNY